ncbi:MAG: hypothetical protein NZL96_01320 [Patescibacteria group bacterium]|nr:hypothetical protein [Patescibacteria group bacterium]
MKFFILLISIASIVFFLGKSLLPFNDFFFDFHDETQPARIQEFVLNLKNLNLPPRIAPNFSFNLGYPVFTYYAPSSYWLTSFFHLIGFSIIDSLKISFLLALLMSFFSMTKLMSLFFNFWASAFVGLLYASSPWLAVEIFVRGNLAELWFIAVLPLSIYFLIKNSQESNRQVFFFTCLAFVFILSVHNILSLIFFPFLVIFILVNKHRERNLKALGMSLLVNSYFYLPAFFQLNLINTANLLSYSNYLDHFLCLWQLWTAPYWGYGGSNHGCQDGMSFMIGKPQILLGSAGLLFFLLNLRKFNQILIRNFLVILNLLLLSIFFVSYLSFSFSKIFFNFFNFFQFPWRWLSFAVFGLVSFSGFLSNCFPKKRPIQLGIILFFVGLGITVYNSKFFTKTPISIDRFNQNFLSSDYVEKRVVYKIADYLPWSVNYQTWLQHEPKKNQTYLVDQSLEDKLPAKTKNNLLIKKNEPFEREFEIKKVIENKVIINIHYLPHWKIFINGKEFFPEKLDLLGRPEIKINQPSHILIKYQQTPVEKVANFVSLLTLIWLGLTFFKSFSRR